MKSQKKQFRQTLLILSSLLLVLCLCMGCSKQESSYTLGEFIEQCQEAFSIEGNLQALLIKSNSIQENDHLEGSISFLQAKAILEELAECEINFEKESDLLSEKQASTMIEQALNAYLNSEADDQEIIEYVEGILDLTKEAIQVEDNLFSISDSHVEIGSIILVFENGQKKAKKIDRIEGNYIYTIDPELEEVVNNLDINQEITIDEEQIELEEGVTFLPSSLSTAASNINFILKLDFVKDQLTLSSDFGKLLGLNQSIVAGGKVDLSKLQNASILPDKLYTKNQFSTSSYIQAYINKDISISELKQKLNLNQVEEVSDASFLSTKYSKGYELYGELEISNLSIHPNFQIVEGKIQSLSIDLNYSIHSKLTLEGKLEESLKLGSMHIPLSSGITIDLDLYLTVNANGNVTVEIKHANHIKSSYGEGIYKKVSAQSTNVGASGALKLNCGPTMDFAISFLGMKITNAELFMSAELKPSTKLSLETNYEENDDLLTVQYQGYLKNSLTVYAPIITFKLGTKDSLAKKLGITMKWKVLDEGDVYSYEIYSDSILLYEESESLEVGKDLLDGILELSDYYVALDVGQSVSIEITNIPEGYSRDQLIYEIGNSSLAINHENRITALVPGYTTLMIKTKDELYEARCVVYIRMNTQEEFIGL